MQKDFITATPDSGGSGSTTVTATAPANQTESARSVNLSVAGGGMTRTVGASQAAGVVTWNYYFSVTPTSLSFVAGGETKSVTVTSYRKKVINGVETSTQENVNYTVSVTGTGFSGSGTTVTAAANSATSTRTGTATYTQDSSGKTAEVNLTQAAYVAPGVTLTITGMSDTTYFLFKGNTSPAPGSSSQWFGILGRLGDYTIRWSPTRPLSVNDPTQAGKTTTATAGDLIVIRTPGGGWRSVGSVTLKNKDQTVRVTG